MYILFMIIHNYNSKPKNPISSSFSWNNQTAKNANVTSLDGDNDL